MRFVTVFVAAAWLGCASQIPRPPVTDGIDGILDAFRDHSIVAVGEAHRSTETHQFLRALIADPRFLQTVDDVVVEFGNERYQPVLDRYVAGEDVPEAELARVWRDTTQLLVWDSPVYRQLLDAVRAANLAASSGRRLRVVAGDPPIDWSTVRTGADYQRYAARDPDTARILATAVLARHRKALLVIGSAHIYKRDPLAGARGGKESPGAVELVTAQHPGSVFVVWTALGAPPSPELRARQLVRVAGTALGARSFGELTPGEITLLRTEHGRQVPHVVRPTDYPPIASIIDALIWLGPTATEVLPPPGTYADAAYVETLRFRARILSDVFGIDFGPIVDEAIAGH